MPIVHSSTYRRCPTCRCLWRKDYSGPVKDVEIPCPNCDGQGPQEGVVRDEVRERLVNEALSQVSVLIDPELDDLLRTAVVQESDAYRTLATAIFCRGGNIVAHAERWAVKFALMERGCLRSG